jgi:hypothetical protein
MEADYSSEMSGHSQELQAIISQKTSFFITSSFATFETQHEYETHFQDVIQVNSHHALLICLLKIRCLNPPEFTR